MKTYQVAFLATSLFLLTIAHPSLADHPEVEGFFPAAGGPITVQPTSGPIQTSGFQFKPVEGTVTAGDDPTPFAFFLPDTAEIPTTVTVASLREITIDGPVVLDIVASSDAVIDATWGKGVNPVPFFVTGGGGGLKGSFPYDGGSVTIEPRFDSTPYTATELSLEATAGSLTSDGSAAPFASLSENTTQKWRAESSAGVTIDGPVVLGVSASADALISGLANDGTNSTNVFISRKDPEPTNALVASYPLGGGPLTIESTAGPVVTRSLDFASASGTLQGIGDNSPAPYSTLDPNNSSNRWKVSSSTDVIIDGRIKLDVETTSHANIKGVMTDGTGSKGFDVKQRQFLSINGSYPFGGGPITLSTQRIFPGTELHGIELTASQGTLTGGGSAAPFESLDTNEASKWSVSSSAPITLDGNVTLDVVASDNTDIQGAYDDGYEKLPFEVYELQPPRSDSVKATFPLTGGPITIEPTSAPIVSRGIEFSSGVDAFTSGGSAAPFETLTSNTARHWSASSAADITIDGPVTLDVSAKPNSGPFPGAINTSNGWEGFNVKGTQGKNGSGLVGTFPNEGGAITISPIDTPIVTGGIEITATEGTLTQGENARPFQFFLSNNNNPNTVTWGVLGSGVVIDGPVTLDARASADAVLNGQWGDGTTPVAMTITQNGTVVTPVGPGKEVMENPPLSQESIDLAMEDLDPAVLESQLLVLFPEDGGPLTLMATNGPVETLGIEFVADSGSLFKGDSAEPFQFFIEGSEDPKKVVLGSLGVPAVIDEPITLDIFASADAVLSGQWGEGALGTFAALAVPNVPEPRSNTLACIVLFSLLTLRGRESKGK